MKRLAAIAIAALALTLTLSTSAHAAQDAGTPPPTCDFERWWSVDVCGSYPWSVSIQAECQRLDPKVALADPVCRPYVTTTMTKRYWVDNCQRQRLGLKGKPLAQWRHWCHGIRPRQYR